MVVKLNSAQSSIMMLEVALIVSRNNEKGIGSFSIPVDDDFIEFAVELECDMIDIPTLRWNEE